MNNRTWKNEFLSLYSNMAAPNVNGRLHLTGVHQKISSFFSCLLLIWRNQWLREGVNKKFISRYVHCHIWSLPSDMFTKVGFFSNVFLIEYDKMILINDNFPLNMYFYFKIIIKSIFVTGRGPPPNSPDCGHVC